MADTTNGGLYQRGWPTVYVPITLVLGDIATLIVRTQGEASAIVRGIREQVKAVDPSQAVSSTLTGEEIQRAAPGWARAEVLSSLSLLFATMGLALAAIGLYSVVSCGVAQRTREFRIRSSLGAGSADLLWRAVGASSTAVVIGAALGIVLSLLVDRAAIRWAQMKTRDPLVLASVVGILLAVAVLASLLPARRATTVDPVVALRYE